MTTDPVVVRERALARLDAGRSLGGVAEVVDVGTATLTRWRRRQRETGGVAPLPSPGRPARSGPDQHAAPRAQVRAHPDATLAAHGDRWAETTGDRVRPATLCRTRRRRDPTLTKSA